LAGEDADFQVPVFQCLDVAIDLLAVFHGDFVGRNQRKREEQQDAYESFHHSGDCG
jgi:hypothetical protein